MNRVCLGLSMLLAVGCGGDLCSATVADVAGTWEFTFSDGGDAETVTLEISDEGTVDVSTDDGPALDCNLERDDLCDLEVVCADADGDEFRFTIKRTD
jgi:hypothetical protein